MSWPCRLVLAPGDGPFCTPWDALQVGDMWLAPHLLERQPHPMLRLGPKYFSRHAPNRAPLIVRLPGVCDFSIDGLAWKDGQAYGDGWDVSGTPPLITVAPSINIVGIYHGFLRDGVISDDCEGGQYDERGQRRV